MSRAKKCVVAAVAAVGMFFAAVPAAHALRVEVHAEVDTEELDQGLLGLCVIIAPDDEVVCEDV